MDRAHSPDARWRLALLAAGLTLLAGQWLLRAWIADDAYITYRVVDNLLNGWGLRWNVDDRVQVFTHPLWVLLHVPFGAALGSLPTASLVLSSLCLGGLLAVLWRGLGLDRLRFLLAVVLPLLASGCLGDYAISGLENPLTALLFGAFAGVALARPERPRWMALGLLLGLTAIARLDALLCLTPAFLGLAIAQRGRLPGSAVALSLAPLVAWQAFSLFYYGFALPNTKVAKLDTGIAAGALALQGAAYLVDFARHDPASALMIAVALGVAARAALRGAHAIGRAERMEALVVASLGAGLVLHLAYVIWIGGDFMRGRHFAAPVVLAVALCAPAARRTDPRRLAAAPLLLLLVAGSSAIFGAGRSPDDTMWRGIADERAMFAPHTALLDPTRPSSPERHAWAMNAQRVRTTALVGGGRRVVSRGNVGLFGFYAGPEVIVIDTFGLGDPLLARLPVEPTQPWRIGHFWRAPPPGYIHARATGDAGQMDPELRRYWEALHLVVSGPLLSPERIREIVRFQLGANDAPRDRWLAARDASRP